MGTFPLAEVSTFVQTRFQVSSIVGASRLAYACMRCSSAVTLALLAGLPGTAQQPPEHTITSNIQYRLSQGGLPKLSFGIEKAKNVEVTEGGEELLQNCLNDSALWTEDPLLFRLAHTHAASIQSCRENRSPSLHAIFRKTPDEPLQAWLHLDGHGAQTLGSRMAHLSEVLYHKITFQNNDQDRMFENLERSFSNPLSTSSAGAIPLDAGDRLTLFTDKTVTQVQPYAASVLSSAFFQLFSQAAVWGRGTDRFTNHLVASFTQRLATYGIQSGAAAALHEDLRYRPSLSRNVWKRTGHALLSTFVLETPRGPDIALANIVAAVGSGMIINATLPGRENSYHPGVWKFTGRNLLGFAEGNLWNEFKPDIKHFLRTKFLGATEPRP
jgi:hypothetical protein